MTPQREYPTSIHPGFGELGVPVVGSSSDQNRTSFRDADGQGIWKEIHTDSGGQCSSGGGSVATNILTPSSREQSPRPRPSHSSNNSAYVEPPTVLTSPSNHAVGGGGRSIAVNTTSSKNYYYRHGMLRGGPKVPHSTQNVNILSPQQLRPLEKSPNKGTLQLHVTNPRVTEELTPSPEQGAAGPAYDHDVEQLHHTSMLPQAAAARSPHQVTLSSPVGTPMSPSTKPKEMVKPSRVNQTPRRPSVSKDRSPDRSWKSSFRAVLPAVAATATTLQNRGMRRELNSSFQGNSSGRAAAAACVNLKSSSVPRWRGCGDSGAPAMAAPVRDHRETCQGDLSGELERPSVPHKIVGGKQKLSSSSTPKSSSYNIFSLLSWGKKKPSTGITTVSTKRQPTATESRLEYSDDYFGAAKADSDSIKVLDYTIKTLRHKLEQANQKRATALDEVCALQSTLEASEEKCRQLTRRCLDLELQFSARSSGLWDMSGPEERTNNADTYFVGRRREPNPALHVAATLFPRPSHQELLTPEQFLQVFEDAIANLRKLASAICHHIRENGESATQVITALLEQHKVGRAVARMPRNVTILYFESFLNQVMFESFENVSFEPNGASSIFCPETLKQQSLQALQSLRSVEWSAIEKTVLLGKPGAVVVNASFHRFFVVRMQLILSQLGKLAEIELSLALMAAFFDAVKAVWLVHHMAFAFDHPVSIFRASPASEFDARFMELVTAFEEDEPPQVGVRSKISIMLNPGFIVSRQIIKCQVYCSSRDE